jgi:hypothetical protein
VGDREGLLPVEEVEGQLPLDTERGESPRNGPRDPRETVLAPPGYRTLRRF